MQTNLLKFLKSLLSTNSPSGFEKEAAQAFYSYLKPSVDVIQTDVIGNVISILNPNAKMKVMIAGHLDEIGFQITALGKDGLLAFRAVGGINKQTLPGMFVNVYTEKNTTPISGVICAKPAHFLEANERDKAPDIKHLWIDVGAENLADLQKLHLAQGDYACVAPNVMQLGENRLVSKGIDDKIGAFITAEVMRQLSTVRKRLKVGVYGVGTVQEEVGCRGAHIATFNINPDIGFCIDVGFTCDTPDIDCKQVGECVLGKGPILVRNGDNNPILAQHLLKIAHTKKIPCQRSAGRMPTGGNDTAIMQLARGGTATALFSLPSRYMHSSVEMIDLRDVQSTIDLITQSILAFDEKMTFNPQYR